MNENYEKLGFELWNALVSTLNGMSGDDAVKTGGAAISLLICFFCNKLIVKDLEKDLRIELMTNLANSISDTAKLAISKGENIYHDHKNFGGGVH